MPRPPRVLKDHHSYHVTVRCNNRRFDLQRPAFRKLLLYVVARAKAKFAFKLSAVCVMSNHVHYLMEPDQPQDLPSIMHWLNWYSAMCFNRMLRRTGHFWEQRYHSTAFPTSDLRRALNTLRYIHANPKAASVCRGFAYRYSNYGTYENLRDDEVTDWHPAFLRLGETLDQCAARYRRFCSRYLPRRKAGGRKSAWGRRWLGDARAGASRKEGAFGQMGLWPECQVQNGSALPEEVVEAAERFCRANSGWP